MPDPTPAVEVLKISINGIWIRWGTPRNENGHPVALYQIELIDYNSHLENMNKSGEQIHHSHPPHAEASTLGAKEKGTVLKSVGSVDKWHRLIIHQHVHDRFK